MNTTTVIEMIGFGEPDTLKPGRIPIPQPGLGEVLIQVKAAGVNRPDLMREISSTSLIRSSRCQPLFKICFTPFVFAGVRSLIFNS